MATNTFIDNAKVMSKGQITIPKDIREILGFQMATELLLLSKTEMSA